MWNGARVMTKDERWERSSAAVIDWAVLAGRGSLLVSTDGLREEVRSTFVVPGFIQVFALRGSGVIALREEACSSLFGKPRRITVPRPWQPVRVLLNGRRADYSG